MKWTAWGPNSATARFSRSGLAFSSTRALMLRPPCWMLRSRPIASAPGRMVGSLSAAPTANSSRGGPSSSRAIASALTTRVMVTSARPCPSAR
jgi:hypothetical protein